MKKRRHPFLIKLLNWEYWPVSIANIPVVFCWLYYGIRSRDIFFFSAVNPVIETGGVFGESKINILQRIPAIHLPETIFVEKSTSLEVVLQQIRSKNMSFPLIAKPDIGERGFLVQRLEQERDLIQYFQKSEVAFLVQEFIDYPVEISVLYHRFPEETKGEITSFCIKETLKVSGDGKSTIEQLMRQNDRAYLQLARFQQEFSELVKQVPAMGEVIELEPIGNHSRGTLFLNGNEHIDENMTQVFDEVHLQMEDMWYGRFDMKCESIESLREGRDFKILEFNGIASEPAHIYDPSYPLLNKYRDIFRHWHIIYKLGEVQRQRGVESMGWREAASRLRAYFKYMKAASV